MDPKFSRPGQPRFPVIPEPRFARPPDFRPFESVASAFAPRPELIRRWYIIEQRSSEIWVRVRAVERELYDDLADARREVQRLRALDEAGEIEYRIVRRLEYVVE